MTMKLNIDFDEFEKSLTPEVLEKAFCDAGFEVELKEEYKKTSIVLNSEIFSVETDVKHFEINEKQIGIKREENKKVSLNFEDYYVKQDRRSLSPFTVDLKRSTSQPVKKAPQTSKQGNQKILSFAS